ncbi:hypothetical protein EV421DRAFT_1939475 [Armillaria borealis]|uniref:Uncharacterized protein n=1 Tax=Armillaria borealis TaxID=47425 RepID=A0AA39IUI9_9AGAR|nr:hypothetical protein EV421DRAFT_1939475 [Armillaria borealis]
MSVWSGGLWHAHNTKDELCQVAAKAHGRNPCFYQVDLCVRALLLDEKVSYVLPFIVIQEARKGGKAHALFTHPSHCPPPAILNTLPKMCRSATCTDSKCVGLWQMEAFRTLHYPSPMKWSSVQMERGSAFRGARSVRRFHIAVMTIRHWIGVFTNVFAKLLPSFLSSSSNYFHYTLNTDTTELVKLYDNLSSGVSARMLWHMFDFKSGFREGTAVMVSENSVSACVDNLIRGADSTVVGGGW